MYVNPNGMDSTCRDLKLSKPRQRKTLVKDKQILQYVKHYSLVCIDFAKVQTPNIPLIQF